MIYFIKYSENKFDILNKHKVFFTKKQVELYNISCIDNLIQMHYTDSIII